jgi:hypothetical protein
LSCCFFLISHPSVKVGDQMSFFSSDSIFVFNLLINHEIGQYVSRSCTIGTRIITMITLISDKFVLIKVYFSIRDLVHQRLGWSTPSQMARPGSFAHPGKGVLKQHRIGPCGGTRWSSACQPQFVGRYRRQASSSILAPT